MAAHDGADDKIGKAADISGQQNNTASKIIVIVKEQISQRRHVPPKKERSKYNGKHENIY